MAQPTKPPVTSVWASTATDNVTPTDSFIAAGWPLSTTPPSRGRFNWLLNYLYNGIRYFSRRGIADYDAAETYMTNDKTMGPDGLTYISLVDNNTANTPASSPTQWARWGMALTETDARYAKLSQFSSSLGPSSFQNIPGGLVFQMGSAVVNSNSGGGSFIAFAEPFPTAAFGCVVSNGDFSASVFTPMVIRSQLVASGTGIGNLPVSTTNLRVDYIAFGH